MSSPLLGKIICMCCKRNLSVVGLVAEWFWNPFSNLEIHRVLFLTRPVFHWDMKLLATELTTLVDETKRSNENLLL